MRLLMSLPLAARILLGRASSYDIGCVTHSDITTTLRIIAAVRGIRSAGGHYSHRALPVLRVSIPASSSDSRGEPRNSIDKV